METTINIEKHRCLVFTEQTLNRLERLFAEEGLKASSISADSDGSSFTFSDFDDLRKFENSRYQPMRSLRIKAVNPTKKSSVLLKVTPRLSKNVTVEAGGNPVESEVLADQVLKIVTEETPWYWWVAKPNYAIMVPVAVLCELLGFMTYIAILLGGTDPTKLSGNFFPAFISMAFVFAILFFGPIGIVMNQVVKRWLPQVIFDLGSGKNRHEKGKVVIPIAFSLFAPGVAFYVAWNLIGWFYSFVHFAVGKTSP